MRTYRVTVAPEGQVFDVQPGERILAAARRAGIWLPFECGWGSCGTCKVTLLEGEVDLLFACPSVTERDTRRRRTVTCQSTPVSDLVIKPTRAQSAPPPERPTADYQAHLADVKVLAPQLRTFILRLDREARYREGQYAILDLGGGLRRCYSMANLAGSSTLEFIVKRYNDGLGGSRLFALPMGSPISVELPYGDMWLRGGAAAVLLIAGGTGISAILALARKLASSGDQRLVRAFYGAASFSELVCWEELRSLIDMLPNGHVHGAVMNSTTGWDGVVGSVTDLLAAHNFDPSDADIYLAGPPPMVDAVLALLRQRAVGLHRIHYDRFG